VSRLQQRLAHLEQSLHPEGRLCAIVDDGSEDIEARIARCGAETGLSARALVLIVKRFPDLLGPAKPGENEPWIVQQIG